MADGGRWERARGTGCQCDGQLHLITGSAWPSHLILSPLPSSSVTPSRHPARPPPACALRRRVRRVVSLFAISFLIPRTLAQAYTSTPISAPNSTDTDTSSHAPRRRRHAPPRHRQRRVLGRTATSTMMREHLKHQQVAIHIDIILSTSLDCVHINLKLYMEPVLTYLKLEKCRRLLTGYSCQ